MQKKQNKGSSVQELLGIKSFTRYGLLTKYGEFLFFSVSPTNITVLSNNAISTKIHNLMMVLSAYPDIEIVCTDSRECFDENKVVVYTSMGALEINGANFHMNKLSLETEEIIIEGDIDSIIYEDTNAPEKSKKSLVSRLFG